jgi:hypothetical protein
MARCEFDFAMVARFDRTGVNVTQRSNEGQDRWHAPAVRFKGPNKTREKESAGEGESSTQGVLKMYEGDSRSVSAHKTTGEPSKPTKKKLWCVLARASWLTDRWCSLYRVHCMRPLTFTFDLCLVVRFGIHRRPKTFGTSLSRCRPFKFLCARVDSCSVSVCHPSKPR